jgi:hypothetical protein
MRKAVAAQVAAEAGKRAAPLAATGAARTFLARAIDGMSGFPGAREVAAKALASSGGVDEAVRSVIEQHVRLAGAQGFLTAFGGALALPVTLPANVAGLGALQLRMVAAIAHLRGHDTTAPRVRIACLAILLGEEEVERAVRLGELPSAPRDLAFGPPIVDEAVRDALTATVGRHLLTRVTSKRAAITVVRQVPLVGGGVGGAVDAYQTWQVGRYADQELVPAVGILRG